MKLPEKASDVLQRILRASPFGHGLDHIEIYSAWRMVAGSEIASHTRVVGIRGNVLKVEVDSSPWLYELSGFRKGQLLADLAANLNKTRVVDIDFRIGRF